MKKSSKDKFCLEECNLPCFISEQPSMIKLVGLFVLHDLFNSEKTNYKLPLFHLKAVQKPTWDFCQRGLPQLHLWGKLNLLC